MIFSHVFPSPGLAPDQVDCEGCFATLVQEEAEFLRDPHLKRIFYETDENDPSLIRDVCGMGFGIVAHEVDCLLPNSHVPRKNRLSQIVFERRDGLDCATLPTVGVECPDD